MNPEVADHLALHSIITPAERPDLAGAIDHFTRTGSLIRVLGNTYTDAETAASFEARVAAARMVYPNCVFTRHTAARLSWWPELKVEKVQASSHRIRQFPGYAFERRDIPPDLCVWNGEHFLTSPALTVLDLVDSMGGAAIDEALRRAVVTMDDLNQALSLTRGRRGNRERARLVRESRHEPWSELERQVHVLLRQAHFTGWVANHPIRINKVLYFADIALPEFKLAAEVDGWQYHKTFKAFVDDRIKRNALSLERWVVLQFTANTLGELVPQMRAGVRMREEDIAMGLRLHDE